MKALFSNQTQSFASHIDTSSKHTPYSSSSFASTMVRIQALHAWYGDHPVLKNINLELFQNQVLAIIGPSGCGKSTLIRCINRLHEEVPQTRVEGNVFLENTPVYGKNTDPVLIRRKVGMVFQKPNPFPSMSISENITLGLKLLGIKKRSVLENTVETTLRKVALWDEVKDKLHAHGTSLSGGQQQRLCIARSLATHPSLLLMDEPTSALDPISTAKIEELIYELKKSITIMIVTHNLQQAGRISNQTAFLLLGTLIEWGPTEKIFTRPSHPKTEAYITGRFG